MTGRLFIFIKLGATGDGKRSLILWTFFAAKRPTFSTDEIESRIDGLLSHWQI